MLDNFFSLLKKSLIGKGIYLFKDKYGDLGVLPTIDKDNGELHIIKSIEIAKGNFGIKLFYSESGYVEIEDIFQPFIMAHLDPENIQSKFKVGDLVEKVSGYEFPGIVDSVFLNQKGEVRLVVEMIPNKLLHIFNESQLKHSES